MKAFYLILSILLIWSCKQNTKDAETQVQPPKNAKPYFFWSVDWHPTEQQLIVGGMHDTLRLLSSNDFQVLKNYPYLGTITKTKWHPSKNKLAISVQDGKSHSTILNLDHDESTKLDSISPEGARAIGWNHSGALLAVGDYEGYLTIFDEHGSFIKKIHTGQKSIIGLDWHPHKNCIVAIGESISLYDYESDSLTEIEDRPEEVLMLCVTWHPDGKFFVTGDYGDFTYDYPPLLQYWNFDGEKISGHLNKSIKKSKAEYRNLKWSSDGKFLATASDKLRLWDQKGDLVAEKDTPDLLWGIDWNHDNSKIVATDEKNRLLVWDKDLNQLNSLSY